MMPPRLPVFGWDSLRGARRAELPSLLDHPRLIYTTSGRASLLLALELLGIGEGDEVLIPTYHCTTMVSPVRHRGAVPVFYPIDERGTPQLAWIEKHDTRRVRAIFVVHFFGHLQPLRSLRSWCEAKQISLIEDCAHALFGRNEGRPVGAWGDIAIGSLPKFLPVLEGGCIAFNTTVPTAPLADCGAAQHLKAGLHILEVGAQHGRLAGLNHLLRGVMSVMQTTRDAVRRRADAAVATAPVAPSRVFDEFGYELDVPLAHRGLTAPTRWAAQRLPRARIVQRRRERYLQLADLLGSEVGFAPLFPRLPADVVPYVFPLWVDEPDPGYAALRQCMPVFRWDQLWPGVPQLPGDVGTSWSRHVLQLACHQDLTDAELNRYVLALRDILGTRRASARANYRTPVPSASAPQS